MLAMGIDSLEQELKEYKEELIKILGSMKTTKTDSGRFEMEVVYQGEKEKRRFFSSTDPDTESNFVNAKMNRKGTRKRTVSVTEKPSISTGSSEKSDTKKIMEKPQCPTPTKPISRINKTPQIQTVIDNERHSKHGWSRTVLNSNPKYTVHMRTPWY